MALISARSFVGAPGPTYIPKDPAHSLPTVCDRGSSSPDHAEQYAGSEPSTQRRIWLPLCRDLPQRDAGQMDCGWVQRAGAVFLDHLHDQLLEVFL